MRSIWKGLISFGLVNIPVALYPAVEDKQLRFNQLHKEDGGRELEMADLLVKSMSGEFQLRVVP